MRRERLCSSVSSNVRKTITLSYSLFSFSISPCLGCLFDEGLCASGQVCWDGECCHILQFQFLTLVQCCSLQGKKKHIMIRLAVLPQVPWNSCVIIAQHNSINAIPKSFVLLGFHASVLPFVILCVHNYLNYLASLSC